MLRVYLTWQMTVVMNCILGELCLHRDINAKVCMCFCAIQPSSVAYFNSEYVEFPIALSIDLQNVLSRLFLELF